jgi:hypothetical protein
MSSEFFSKQGEQLQEPYFGCKATREHPSKKMPSRKSKNQAATRFFNTNKATLLK